MLFLLSPAKSLDYETPTPGVPHTQPLFVKQAEPLIKALRKKSWRQVSKLMDWAQDHLCILSGLYGVLRPLDLMQPYRLEMGTALKVGRPDNLYHYWRKTIAAYLNERLNEQFGERLNAGVQGGANPVVINLASQEYFKSVNLKLLEARVVECVFEDFSNGSFKVVSFFAKKARGMMARHAITHRIQTPETLQGFSQDGYVFYAAASTADRMVFRRKMAAAA